MTSAEVFFYCVVAALIGITLRGREAWPLSAYPMFAGRQPLAEVVVYRVAWETPTGTTEWWRPHFYRYAEQVGLQLQRWHQHRATDGSAPGAWEQESATCLREVLRLLEQEAGKPQPGRALVVVRRTVRERDDGGVSIQDETVAVHTLAALREGGSGA